MRSQPGKPFKVFSIFLCGSPLKATGNTEKPGKTALEEAPSMLNNLEGDLYTTRAAKPNFSLLLGVCVCMCFVTEFGGVQMSHMD